MEAYSECKFKKDELSQKLLSLMDNEIKEVFD